MLLSIFCGIEHHDFFWDDDGDMIPNYIPQGSRPGIDLTKLQDGEDDKYGGMTFDEISYLARQACSSPAHPCAAAAAFPPGRRLRRG